MKKGLLALSFLCVVSSLYAAKDEGIRLKEEVITTTGFAETVKDEIKNVIIITREDIEKKHYNQVTDILKDYSMINVAGTSQGTIINMRGQNHGAIDMKVKVMVDGVPINTIMSPQGFNTIPVGTIEKIEILPGSGAVLYGDRASGGYINIITKKNVDKPFLSLDSGIGSYSKKYTNIFTGTKITDKLGLMVGYNGLSRDGYRDEERGVENSYSGTLRYDITKNQKLILKGEKYKGEINFSDAVDKNILASDRKKAGKELSRWYSTRESYQALYEGKFDNLTLGVQGYKSRINNDTQGNRFTACTMDIEGIGLKGRYEHSNGVFITGYDYNKNNGIMTSSSTKMDVDKITNAIYMLEKYKLSEKLVLSIGGRQEWNKYDGYRKSKEKLNIDNEIDNYGADIGLNYLYSNTGNAYIKVERGFVAPTPRQLANRIKGEYVGNNLGAEKSTTYEIGMKDSIFGSYISATGFFSTTKDEISYQSLGNRDFRYENLDETERKGIELTAEQYLGKLILNESFTFIDAEISKGEKKGKDIPNVPEKRFVLSAMYEVTDKLVLNTSVNYTGSMYTGDYDKDSNIVTDISATYDLGRGLSIYGGVNNLFNEKYYLTEDKDTGIPADERNYYVGFKYNI